MSRSWNIDKVVKDFDTERGTSGLRKRVTSPSTDKAYVLAVPILRHLQCRVAVAAAEESIKMLLSISFKLDQPVALRISSLLVEICNSMKPPDTVYVRNILMSHSTVRGSISRLAAPHSNNHQASLRPTLRLWSKISSTAEKIVRFKYAVFYVMRFCGWIYCDVLKKPTNGQK